MDTTPLRIAMWSGPRNISTAMMRSWGNRPDTYVCDEPLYAHYLTETQLGHPGRDEVILHHETNWRKVTEWLTGPVPEGKRVFYQKHMSHHLLPNIERGWLDQLTHCFLIRDPQEMLTSLIKHIPHPTIQDTGLPQQIEIVKYLKDQFGSAPIIMDVRDILSDPQDMLNKLCIKLGVVYINDMLSWPPGRRDTDGIWAKHWYDAVEKSTGFQPYKPKNEEVPVEHQNLLADCVECYQELYVQRLK